MGVEVDVKPSETGEDSIHLWSCILKEVANARIGKLPHNKGVVVLGDYGTGKSTLACRLSHKHLPPRSPGLEYHFVDIRDEATDDQTKLSVWILDGDLEFIPYLKFPLDKRNFANRMVVIVVDMERPWNIMNELEKWANALEDYIKSMDIEVEEMQEYKDSLVRHFREYIEPDSILLHSASGNSGGTDIADGVGEGAAPVAQVSRPAAVAATGGNPLHPATAALLRLSGLQQQQQNQSVLQDDAEEEGDEDDVDEGEGGEGEMSKPKRSKKTVSDVLKELPITPGALINNLGIPLVVVVTKTDVMDDMERKQGMSEEQYDIIQMHIRRFCLSYGAALIYVSAKNGKNCGLLKNYLQHRIYGFPFTQNAYVIDKDCVFIPAGWDSLNKIGLLEQNLTKYRPGDEFDKVVPKPEEQAKTANKEPAVTAVDDQYFLSEIYTALQHDASAGGGSENGTPSHEQSSILDVSGNPPSRPSSGSASRSRSSGAGIAGGLSSSSSEKVLANFFNNLLSKGPSARQTPNGPPPSSFNPLPPETNTKDKMLPDASGFGDASTMSAREMQSELERLARTSKEALDNSSGLGDKAVTTEKSS